MEDSVLEKSSSTPLWFVLRAHPPTLPQRQRRRRLKMHSTPPECVVAKAWMKDLHSAWDCIIENVPYRGTGIGIMCEVEHVVEPRAISKECLRGRREKESG